MGKVLIGNIKGPQGPTGVRGGMWLQGTAVTGTSTEETSFPDSNITYAIIGDAYFNVETCNVYACTKAGNPTDAKWVYTGNIKGVKGDTGSTQSIQNAVLEFNEALTRENIESTDTVETIFGKVKKYFTDLGSAAFMNVVNNVTQSEAGQAVLDAAVGKYLEEKKFDISKIIANRNITEPGFVMDGKTVADALTELNGNINTISRGNSFKIWSIGEWKNSGGNFPGNYGVIIRTLGYSRPGHFAGDSYFLAIVYTGLLDIPSRLYSGSMINQEQEVTWIPYVLTSDLGYTDVTMDTVRGSNNYVPNITGMNYIPVVLRVSSDYTGVSVYGNRGANSWLVISPTEQNMTIRFYKYPA